jgi:hypothetical protein
MFKYIYIVALFILFGNIATAQTSFYDKDTVQHIEIKFAFNDWDNRLDTAAVGAEGYTVALWCKINGQQFDSVGVKYKGNSSFKVTNKKNPLHIELNYVKKQDYQGFKDIKLSNSFADPTFIREQLSYSILKNYMDVSDCNQAQVVINGQLYGLMTNIEAVNKTFLKQRFGNSNGTFIKCNPIESPGGSSGLPSLVFLGKDSSLYQKHYELKSATGWKQLVNLIDTLNNYPSKLNSVLDIDRTLWMLAYNNLFVNLDSYSGAFAQNYYLYRDKTNRFLPIPWDLNMSFGGFTRTGESAPLAITALPNLNLLLHNNSPDRPLLKTLLNNDRYRKMYVAKLRTMLDRQVRDSSYFQKAMLLQSFIDTLVKKDKNNFFTYAQFSSNMIQSANGAGAGGTNGVVPGLKPLMTGRLAYLNAQPSILAIQPSIDSIQEPKIAKIGQVINVLSTVQNATTVLFRYRFDKQGIFKENTMFDDGLHNDGLANDKVFGTSALMEKKEMQYYIYAENALAGKFSPQDAEYNFHKIKADLTNPTTEIDVLANLELYPNPASNQLFIQKKFGNEPLYIREVATGRLVYTLLNVSENIDISNWPKGSYCVDYQNFTKVFLVQ